MADDAATGTAGSAPQPAAKTAPAPVAGKATTKSGVAMKDQFGQDLGFSVDVSGSAANGEDLAGLAERVKGWTDFQLDGKPYEYSPENARALVSRFPHFAEQLRAG